MPLTLVREKGTYGTVTVNFEVRGNVTYKANTFVSCIPM